MTAVLPPIFTRPLVFGYVAYPGGRHRLTKKLEGAHILTEL